LKELIRDSILLRNLIISICLWSASQASYYTVYFHIRYLPGDLFWNTLVFACCEVSAYFIGSILTKKIGIKPSLVASFLLAIASTGVYLLIRNNEKLQNLTAVALAAAGFGIVWACSINWNGNASFFPVIYASSTNGICNLFGRLSASIAP
jgi:Na+/melibiose symporter-like transporter